MAPSPATAPAAPGEPPGVRDASDRALVRSLLTGVEAFRWLAWAWLAVLLVISRRELRDPEARPGVAVGLAALALAVTIATSVLRRRAPHRMTSLAVVAAEVAVGCVLEVGDAVAFNGVPHPQSLSSAWPLAGILTAGIAGGRRAGLAAGLVVAAGGSVGNLVEPGPWTSSDTVSSASTAVLLALAGGIAGLVSTRLRAAERFTALARAREEVARTLHDGVLQTLAVVQHRADDPVLARLAHDQERELL
jgi:signal transduction histidine kinase